MSFPFCYSRKIRVQDTNNKTAVVILKSDIVKLYSGIGLKKSTIKQIVKAHETVLRYGLKTGNERVVVIDSETGKIVADEVGTSDRVSWHWNPEHNKKLITIHNHPNSSTFSQIDLLSFGSNKQTLCMGIQGHNGRMYSLRKTANIHFNLTQTSLFLVLAGIISVNRGKSDVEIGEIFVRTIANANQWEFLKGVE